MEFEKFPKIPRYHKLEMLVTEKLDGSNAQINIPENPEEPIIVGSRNRFITPGKSTDNYGFAQWVQDNTPMLRRLGPGRHYGEWYGRGIGRGYGLEERRFALFNVHRFAEGLPEGPPVEFVPILYQGPILPEYGDNSLNSLAIRLWNGGSVAIPGYMNPEGMVITLAGVKSKWLFDKHGHYHKDTKPASPEEGV